MKPHGYHFCDHCEELAIGPRCEHCNARAPTVRWVPQPPHDNPFRRNGGGPKPVSRERGRVLWAKLHAELGL